MKINLYRLHYLIIINFLLIIVIVMIAKFRGYDFKELLMSDDGYILLSKKLYNGESIMTSILGPGIPIIYYAINFFPESLQPFIRLFISLLFSTGIIIIVHYSILPYLNKKKIFIGSLFFIFNPVYVQWTIKNCPEIFVGFFLALFIFFLLKTIRTNKLLYFILTSFVLFISFFIKPVFLLVPLPLIIYYILLRDKRLIIFSIVLLIVGGLGFYTYNLNAPKWNSKDNPELRYSYGQHANIAHTLWINYVIKTKQFYKNSIRPYVVYDDLENYFPDKHIWLYEGFNGETEFQYAIERYAAYYYKENPQGTAIGMDINFILDYPGLFLQKLIFSPFFFLGISAHGTIIKLIYNLFFITIGIVSLMKCIKTRNKKEILSIITVVIGYSLVYLTLYSYDRYSLPILPWLIVWSGYYISHVSNKLLVSRWSD